MADERVDLKRFLHQLRSPLAVIHTTTSLMDEMPDDTELGDIRRHLRLIQEAVEKARDLVDETDDKLDRE